MSAQTDFVIRIKNGYLAQKPHITAIYSKLNENIAAILKKEGYIKDFSVEVDGNKKNLHIELLYAGRDASVQDVKLYSRSGQRRYAKKEEIRPVLGGLGIAVISTPKGVMTDKQARLEKIGGEILFSIW